MREDRDLLEMLVIFLELELRAENGIPPAGVDDIARLDLLQGAVSVAPRKREHSPFFRELNLIDAGFLAHFGAAFRGVIEQELVEIRARYLIGAVRLRAKAVFKIELHALPAAGAVHLAPELFHKTGARELFMQTQPGESLHAERQQRFADMEARKLLPLQNDHATPGPRQQGARSAARRPTADDRHVVHFAAHWVTKVANFPGMKRI
jgi:hypothetical protein